MAKRKNGRMNLYFGIAIVMFLLAGGMALLRQRNEVVLEPLSAEEIETQNQEALRINRMIYDTDTELERLKKDDLNRNNGRNQAMLDKLKANLQLVTDSYEESLDLRYNGAKIDAQEEKFKSLLSAAQRNSIEDVDNNLSDLLASLGLQNRTLFVTSVVAGTSIPSGVPAINQAPVSGFRRQKVTAGGRSFLVDIQAADLNSTRVIVDTASDGTCTHNCPVLPLATYVGRSGAYAGINGTYFCPNTYPSCKDKTNSFDLLVMNKNKVYFNSENNVFSVIPAAIFSHGSSRFVTTAREWGRDTGVDAVISNGPMLTFNGNVMTGGGDTKENIRGNRSFVGGTGNMAYMGVIRSASVAEAAQVLQAMGIQNAINLDNGGSTAFWSGGYKAGPGRRIPNAVLFVNR